VQGAEPAVVYLLRRRDLRQRPVGVTQGQQVQGMAEPAGQGGGGFAAEPGFQPGRGRQEMLLGRRELPGVAQRDSEEGPRVERVQGFVAEGLRA